MRNPFIRFLVRRILISMVLVWGIVTLTFLMIHFAPGDPTAIYLNPQIPPEVHEQIRHNLGLDQPVAVQYVKWLRQIAQFDFGYSFIRHQSVLTILQATIPNTLLLTFSAFLLESLLALFLGIYSAVRAGSRKDFIVNYTSLFLFSIPEFWLALFGIYIFAIKLGWLPTSQMMSIDFASFGIGEKIVDLLRHLILPVSVLSLTSMAYSMRLVRSSLIEALNTEHVRYVRAMGVPEKKVQRKYALRTALIPFVTHLGMSLPFLLGGSFIIENIFSWPGMGQLTMSAIMTRDYPVIMAANMLSAFLVVFGNLLADLLYAWIDPRIQLQ